MTILFVPLLSAFLAYRTNGRTYATAWRLSSVTAAKRVRFTEKLSEEANRNKHMGNRMVT